MSKARILILEQENSGYIVAIADPEDGDKISISCAKESTRNKAMPFEGDIVRIPRVFLPALIETLGRLVR